MLSERGHVHVGAGSSHHHDTLCLFQDTALVAAWSRRGLRCYWGLKPLLTLMAASLLRSNGYFADLRLSAQNEIKMVPEAEHLAEVGLNAFKDIFTAV